MKKVDFNILFYNNFVNLFSIDIEMYPEDRFRMSKLIAQTLMPFLKLVGQSFFDYVLDCHLTATFEFLQVDHQHIELFDFKDSKFRFIAFTHNDNFHELCEDIQNS
jgi:hypothetical protein